MDFHTWKTYLHSWDIDFHTWKMVFHDGKTYLNTCRKGFSCCAMHLPQGATGLQFLNSNRTIAAGFTGFAREWVSRKVAKNAKLRKDCQILSGRFKLCDIAGAENF
jgi:hypothetical protein